MEIKKRFIFLVSLAFISFIFICTGTGGSVWVHKELYTQAGTIDQSNGLWRTCSQGYCISITATTGWLNACRSMTIISCLCVLTSLALSIMSYIEPRVKGWMISLVTIIAASTMIIALVVFLVKNQWTNNRSYDYGWTFIISWIGVIASLICAVWAILMSRID